MTPLTLTSLDDLTGLAVDSIIDVRAPAEFAEDHLPGAINLPVLDDAQRAEVGTIYTRESPFKARKLGGALVARNTANHLLDTLAGKQGDWQPLVYCWRGGQRSGAFSTILSQVGWRVKLLEGGYRSYRRLIVAALYDTPLPHRIMLVSGGTGTAKTDLLYALEAQGAQMLDLEGMANHRGSLFGARADGQPAQKLFETRLASRLRSLDPDRLTWVEAESSRVGECTVPPSLWAAMQDAPRIEIAAPLAARAQYLAQAYVDLTRDATTLKTRIEQLRPFHAAEAIGRWQRLAIDQEWETLAGGLIEAHYDPRYAKSASTSAKPERRFDLETLTPDTLAKTAATLLSSFN